MDNTLTDMIGQPIFAGCHIAYGTKSGSYQATNIGLVLEVNRKLGNEWRTPDETPMIWDLKVKPLLESTYPDWKTGDTRPPKLRNDKLVHIKSIERVVVVHSWSVENMVKELKND